MMLPSEEDRGQESSPASSDNESEQESTVSAMHRHLRENEDPLLAESRSREGRWSDHKGATLVSPAALSHKTVVLDWKNARAYAERFQVFKDNPNKAMICKKCAWTILYPLLLILIFTLTTVGGLPESYMSEKMTDELYEQGLSKEHIRNLESQMPMVSDFTTSLA